MTENNNEALEAVLDRLDDYSDWDGMQHQDDIDAAADLIRKQHAAILRLEAERDEARRELAKVDDENDSEWAALKAELAAAREQIATLRALAEKYYQDVRARMIGTTYSNREKRLLDEHSCECTCNGKTWRTGEPERHEPDCPARPNALDPEKREAPR